MSTTPDNVAKRVRRQRLLLLLTLAVLGCAADLLSKHFVFQWRGLPQPGNEWWLIRGYVGVETAINTGALFGLGHGQVTLFAFISVVAIIGILVWVAIGGAAHDLLLTIALGIILGGIVGNLYDRVGLWGQRGVRDWILFRYESYTWPNFNIADSLLVCGAVLLFVNGFRGNPCKSPS